MWQKLRGVLKMRNQWLDQQITQITTTENKAVMAAIRQYITELEDDNESLQVALEGSVWSPKRWNEKIN
ncbi:hypothetical protein IV53_GL000749 [Ligilactobacillus ceti DSM 22408]|uniref:Uncharacterized protein n=2 Tax=Ligilactobacillus TaxID=2767887 RepID=A0A0R2KRH1_9LACO|nr:hypothetical protein IV53_GL000749 [Ligilactobacillus ceti DSM 22408]